MKKRTRVKKTDTFDKRDLALLSEREATALADGYTVNIPENVARTMIAEGWVINLDPMKNYPTKRTVADVVNANPGLAGNVPEYEVNDGDGTAENIPGVDSGTEVRTDVGDGESSESGPANPGLITRARNRLRGNN